MFLQAGRQRNGTSGATLLTRPAGGGMQKAGLCSALGKTTF